MSSASPVPPEGGRPRLLECFLKLTAAWRTVFPRRQSFARATAQALGGLLCLGRRTLSRILCTNGRAQKPWAADYHLHARCQWEPPRLFDTVWQESAEFCRGGVVGVAFDDTRLHKTGRCIRQAFYQRDPLSPPFHVNLMLGLRFFQCSLLLPAFRGGRRFTLRALPVHFSEVSRVKKPGQDATAREQEQWKKAQKEQSLPQHAVQSMRAVRAAMDRAGMAGKTLVMAGDGSFCNRTCFGASLDRTELLVRCRKDAVLCRRADDGGRRFYGTEKFTPEGVRQDAAVPWEAEKLHYGGKKRRVRYKELTGVFWQGGARRRELRLIVIAPTPYQKRKSSRLYYRQPAYLLTTDLHTPAKKLIQIYLDRWQIEVNHREEKETLGIGQAQLWNEKAGPRQPVLAVPAYSVLLLAGLKVFGAERTPDYAPLPKWRSKRPRRASCLDLLVRLRHEATAADATLLPPLVHLNPNTLITAAAA